MCNNKKIVTINKLLRYKKDTIYSHAIIGKYIFFTSYLKLKGKHKSYLAYNVAISRSYCYTYFSNLHESN